MSGNSYLLGLSGAVVLYDCFGSLMALLVEALKILLNGIWSFLEVGGLGVNLLNLDALLSPEAGFSKLQVWRNIFHFNFSVKERLPSKISAVLGFHVAAQPIKDVFDVRVA